MRTAILAALMMLNIGGARANAEPQGVATVWQSDQAGTRIGIGAQLVRDGDAFQLLTPSSLSDLSGEAVPLPEVSTIVLANESRYVGLVSPESHYFSGGVHGRLVAGALGSMELRRLRGLGEVRPVAALHAEAHLYVVYTRDDETGLRVASFTDGADRGRISVRFPGSPDYRAAHGIFRSSTSLQLLSAQPGANRSDCDVQIRLLTLDRERLTPTNSESTCLSGLRNATLKLHRVESGAWYIVGFNGSESVAWLLDLNGLQARELWRGDVFRSWNAISTVDPESGVLFITSRQGTGEDLPLIRIEPGGDVQINTLAISCPIPARRFAAAADHGQPFLLARAGDCARLWRLH